MVFRNQSRARDIVSRFSHYRRIGRVIILIELEEPVKYFFVLPRNIWRRYLTTYTYLHDEVAALALNSEGIFLGFQSASVTYGFYLLTNRFVVIHLQDTYVNEVLLRRKNAVDYHKTIVVPKKFGNECTLFRYPVKNREKPSWVNTFAKQEPSLQSGGLGPGRYVIVCAFSKCYSASFVISTR